MEIEPTESVLNSVNKPLRSLLEMRELEFSELVALATVLPSTHE